MMRYDSLCAIMLDDLPEQLTVVSMQYTAMEAIDAWNRLKESGNYSDTNRMSKFVQATSQALPRVMCPDIFFSVALPHCLYHTRSTLYRDHQQVHLSNFHLTWCASATPVLLPASLK